MESIVKNVDFLLRLTSGCEVSVAEVSEIFEISKSEALAKMQTMPSFKEYNGRFYAAAGDVKKVFQNEIQKYLDSVPF